MTRRTNICGTKLFTKKYLSLKLKFNYLEDK